VQVGAFFLLPHSRRCARLAPGALVSSVPGGVEGAQVTSLGLSPLHFCSLPHFLVVSRANRIQSLLACARPPGCSFLTAKINSSGTAAAAAYLSCELRAAADGFACHHAPIAQRRCLGARPEPKESPIQPAFQAIGPRGWAVEVVVGRSASEKVTAVFRGSDALPALSQHFTSPPLRNSRVSHHPMHQCFPRLL
jgi:hypothetical protein